MIKSNICPICNSKNIELLSSVRDVEYFTSKKLYEYYNCKECEIIYLKEPPINNLKKIYPDSYYSYGKNINQKC